VTLRVANWPIFVVPALLRYAACEETPSDVTVLRTSTSLIVRRSTIQDRAAAETRLASPTLAAARAPQP
jgi:hypothetical protein